MNQPFCSPVKALRSVLDAAALLPSPSPETIPLEAACGRIAAADLCARMDQPPFDRSPLDGYALHSADTAGASRETPVTLPVVMKLYAGDAPAAALPAGRVDVQSLADAAHTDALVGKGGVDPVRSCHSAVRLFPSWDKPFRVRFYAFVQIHRYFCDLLRH
ncbi:hypothetical protein ACKXF4_15410, partial [Faecalibacterium prausnitzii]